MNFLNDPCGKLNLCEEDAHHFQLFIALAFDQVWMLQNKITLHPTTVIKPLQLANLITRQSRDHLQAWDARQTSPHRNQFSNYISSYCFQYDAIVRLNFSMAAVVCLDLLGNIIEAETRHLPNITDPLIAEAPCSPTCILSYMQTQVHQYRFGG